MKVKTDDDLDVTRYYRTVYESRADTYKVLSTHTYHRNAINEHDIQTHPSFIRHRVVAFKWEPNHLHVTPDQERVIGELVADGTYSKEDAEEVREQLILKAQREAEGLE